MTFPRYTIVYFGIGIALLFIIPSQAIFSGSAADVSNCMHVRLLGIECPGCGFTRATFSLLNLDFKQALSFNPTVIFIIPISILEVIYFSNKSDFIGKVKYLTYISFVATLFILYAFRIFKHINL
jgi:hypothetical protein